MGVTEMVEPGLAGECPAKAGLHMAVDQFLAEIVNPATGEPVPPGQEGELVLTTLTAEAYPPSATVRETSRPFAKCRARAGGPPPASLPF